MKICQVCLRTIPEDYGNLLCMDCYTKQSKEIEQKKTDEKADRDKRAQANPKDLKEAKHTSLEDVKPVEGTPDYIENPEMEDKPQWEANIVQFSKSGHLLWKSTRTMYEFIKNYLMRRVMEHPQYPKFVWKPTIVDVGCGCGCGTNILSQEADFVWGIDKNLKSIQFATEAFTRHKNGIYYSSQVSFDHLDIIKDTRAFMTFDFVVAIEIIEHIADYRTFLKQIIKFAKQRKGTYNVVSGATEFFVSTPNRNNKHISDVRPRNKYHVREMTQEEFVKALSEYFENIEILDSLGRPVGDKTDHTPILAKCSLPKI